MSFRAKRAVLFVLLSTLTVWALVHHVVTERFTMNQWKFVGWAMYCKPAPQVHFSIQAKGRRLQEEEVLSRVGPEELSRFKELRELYGDLHGPERLADAALKAYPDASSLEIYVDTVTMNAGSGMPDYVESVYDCSHDEKRSARCPRIRHRRVESTSPGTSSSLPLR